MRWIVESSVRLGIVVLVAVGVILVAGVLVLSRAPVDTLPELLPPEVSVQTLATGLSSREVEQFLTVPAEYELANVAFLDSLTSRSVPGLSSINLTFKPGVNWWTARQLVSERMAQVPLPVDIGIPPVLIQPLSSSSRAAMIGLSSTSVAPIDMTTLATWRIRPRLLAVPGVANVTIWGQKDREMLVLLDPARMTKQGVSIDQVLTTVGDAMWTSPLTFVAASSPGADGLIDTPNQRLTIQHILPIITSKDLVNVPIEGTGVRKVSVGDISTVIEDHPLISGDAVLNKGPGVVLVVEKLPGADALAVTRGVDQAMSELQPGLGGITVDTGLFRPGTFLAYSLQALGIFGLIAFFAACAWLGWAYRSWRIAVLAGVSIAASLVAACLVLFAASMTFNVMVLTGLVMALGVIVDDAVVGASALRARREMAAESDTEVPSSTIVADAFLLGRKPLGFALAALVLASVPFFFIPGVSGILSRQMILAYLVALVASALVAAIVAPALCMVMPPPTTPVRSGKDSWLAQSVEAGVRSVARWPGLVVALAAIVVVVTVAGALVTLPKSFVPGLRDGSLVIHWQGVSGTSISEMARIAASAEEPIRALPGVRSVSSHVGQAIAGDQVVGTDSAETWISLDPKQDAGVTKAAVNRILAGFPGLGHSVQTYAENTFERAAAGSPADVRVRVYGSNLDQLRSTANQVRTAVAALPGVVNAQVATSTDQPLIQVETDIVKAAPFGLKPGDIRRQAAALLAGIPVGSYYKDQQVFDVTVWSAPAVRMNPDSIRNLPITTASGAQIPLKTVASVTLQPVSAVANHEKASRYLDVSASIRGARASSVVAAIRQAMTTLPLPLGYHVEVTSPLALSQADAIDLALISIAVAIGVFLLMHAAVQSWRDATLVVLLLPFAVSGGLLAAAVFGWGLTFGVVAGAIAVLGIALRNMMMIAHRFRTAGEFAHTREEIRSLASITGESAPAVMATAVATSIAVVPLVLLGNVAGTEILRPFGVVVIGGLVTSTVLTLLILPAVFGRWGTAHARHKNIEGAQ
jgi:Cu/Ag efflux pump CusA